MSIVETIKEIRHILAALTIDLEKAAHGNKAASQRVRTGTIKLEKGAKKYRKESIKAEKAPGGLKKAAAAAALKKATKEVVKEVKKEHKVAPKAKAKHHVAPKAKAKHHVAPKAKAKAKPAKRR
jgi:hypothetical protein